MISVSCPARSDYSATIEIATQISAVITSQPRVLQIAPVKSAETYSATEASSFQGSIDAYPTVVQR